MVPHRHIESDADLKAALAGVERIIIDATERSIVAPKIMRLNDFTTAANSESIQSRIWSLLALASLSIFLVRLLLGITTTTPCLSKNFPPEFEWFVNINVLVNLGFLGIQSDYQGTQTETPYKKPCKSQKNPNPTLTQEQKAYNKALNQIRIFVENAISGIKHYNILVHSFRNHSKGFDDLVIATSAGLWNFSLSY